ncbi:hypothetical protein TRVA0_035S01398 [Trichomonascus vanleenenianus]|uniref:BAG family molecular chaperone regulator n=1 Tax=Trichomonascus vanleenenianus TaxID=2268995 RepID=UPI003ECB6E93
MFRRLATSLGLATPDPPPASVIAHMGSKRYKIEFDEEDSESEKGPTVGFLRAKIAETIAAKRENVTLVHAGRKLNDDSQYLLDCGVKTDAQVLVIASNRPKRVKVRAGPQKSAPKPPKERIQGVLESVKEQGIDTMLAQFKEDVRREDYPLAKAEEDHRKLNELVLQKMFSLDDIDVSEDQELRKFRKEVINLLHSLHNQIDEAYKVKTGEHDAIKQGEPPTDGPQKDEPTEESKVDEPTEGSKEDQPREESKGDEPTEEPK